MTETPKSSWPPSPIWSSSSPSRPPASTLAGQTGLVLSGGGARGAYEAGILSYLYGDFARKHGVPRFDIVSGTSVGAINGAFVASVQDDPLTKFPMLSRLWSELELGRVLRFGVGQALRIRSVILGGEEAGFFDVTPLTKIVSESIDWSSLSRNLRERRLQSLTISATHVATGKPLVFFDGDKSPTRSVGSSLRFRKEPIGPAHVLASAAIPILFPPVPVSGELYVDGGLRLNTPISPALQMGARRVLVVGTSAPPHHPHRASLNEGVSPGLGFLLGKILNAFLLDHVTWDLVELERVNRLLSDGIAIYGADFVDRMNAHSLANGGSARHLIHPMSIHPSEDIGKFAGEYLRKHQVRFGRVFGRALLRLLHWGEGSDSDLVSYLMFDGGFARELMALGYQDAKGREEQFVRFFNFEK